MTERRLAATLRVASLAVVALFFAAAAFAAVVMPYRLWDSLAFGSWSRSIADGNGLWSNADALSLQRPLFYLEQGRAWRVVGDGEWIGRLLFTRGTKRLGFEVVYAPGRRFPEVPPDVSAVR